MMESGYCTDALHQSPVGLTALLLVATEEVGEVVLDTTFPITPIGEHRASIRFESLGRSDPGRARRLCEAKDGHRKNQHHNHWQYNLSHIISFFRHSNGGSKEENSQSAHSRRHGPFPSHLVTRNSERHPQSDSRLSSSRPLSCLLLSTQVFRV